MTEKLFYGARPIPLIFTLILGAVLWFVPHPAELQPKTWHLFSIFVATIVGVIFRPLPVAPMVLLGLVTAAVTKTLSTSQVLSAFSNDQIWLITVAFFIAFGLIKTGLAERISYLFLSLFGKSPIGVAYGLLMGELFIAPFIPSLAARSGGIIYPVMIAICQDFEESYPGKSLSRLKGFLALCAFQGAVVIGGMFLTSMAANPIAVDAASLHGVEITWTVWATAASLPGLVSLLILPWFIFALMKPEIKVTPSTPSLAKQKLADMGAMKKMEKLMFGILLIVLILWVMGPTIGMNSTIAAFVGLSLLLIFGVLTWQDCLQQTKAWDTLFWLGGIVAMGNELKMQGFFNWLSGVMAISVSGLSWEYGFLVLALVYFYSHYLFASNTAHVSAMYAPLLGTSILIGTPAPLAALLLAFFSNLFGGLTHYSSGPAPIFYGARFVSLRRWWGIGLACSILNIVIWALIGSAWWWLIGFW
jgi:DASS family divalent anion:Na+ symporter